MAYSLYLKSYYDAALTYFLKAQDGDAKFETVHYCALACIYFFKREFSVALGLYKKALRVDENCLQAHIKLGKIYLRQKDLKHALKHCEKAVKLEASNSEARNNLGFCYLSLNRIHDAIVQLEVAVALCQDFPKAHNNLGNAYRKLSKNSEAIQHYELAIAQTPKRNLYSGRFAVAHLNLGSTYFEIGETAKAIQHFEEALNAGDSIHKLMVSKGYHLLFKHPKIKEGVESLLRHDYDQASSLLSDVLDTDSDNPAVNYYNGYTLFKQGQFHQAKKLFKKTIE
jgi:tetratricopeptide (TPR) repeat protein